MFCRTLPTKSNHNVPPLLTARNKICRASKAVKRANSAHDQVSARYTITCTVYLGEEKWDKEVDGLELLAVGQHKGTHLLQVLLQSYGSHFDDVLAQCHAFVAFTILSLVDAPASMASCA